MTQFFYDEFKPWVHYVPIKRDWSDMEEKLDYLKKHAKLAEEIANAGYELIWNHLTMDNIEK